MKIEAIVQAQSTENRTAYRTVPPLTKELLDYVFEHHWSREKGVFSTKDGLLIVTGETLTEKQIETCEKTLTDSEEKLAGTKAKREQKRSDDFGSRSDEAGGLPLE